MGALYGANHHQFFMNSEVFCNHIDIKFNETLGFKLEQLVQIMNLVNIMKNFHMLLLHEIVFHVGY